ncbi:MAG: efflux RND transporter periplasmic adaptor subunit [Gammaproteobacteria bacterium]
MIVFLTLCYVGVLAILVKLKVIKLTLWWKISPAVWFVFLLTALIIPMQWGAPAGAVTMFQTVVEIVPNVSGEVIEVPAKPLTPMKKGDVLFKIDPRPFQYRIDRLKAGLTEAEQAIPQLKTSLDSAKAAVSRATAERDRAKREYERNLKLQEQGAAPEREVVRWRTAYETAQATIRDARASEERARLAYESDTTVAQLRADLNTAQYDLTQTTVTAPADGFVTGLTLRPGQRVTNMPLRSWVAYVSQDQIRLVAGINQNMLRHVKPGQRAEVVLKLYPGKTLGAIVESVAYMTPQGQLQPSGIAPSAPTPQQLPAPYGVILKLDEAVRELHRVPGGAVGTAAIYTDSVRLTHIIRRVMVRMDAWLNYIISW